MERSKLSLERQTREKKKYIRGSVIVLDDLSHEGGIRKHQGGTIARLLTTARHHGLSVTASFHSSTSLGSLARRQTCTLIIFPVSTSREYQSFSEQYSRLASRDKHVFDDIYDLAVGEGADPFSFLRIHTNLRDVNKTFMLKLEGWMHPT